MCPYPDGSVTNLRVGYRHEEARFRLACQPPVLRRARCRSRRRVPRRLLLAGRRPGARALLLAHVRGHGRLPPLLLSSDLPHEPRLPVLPRRPRADQRPEGRALVGRASSRSPQVLGHAEGPALLSRLRLLVLARRLDPLDRDRGDRLLAHLRSRALPGAPLAQQLAPRSAGRARRRALARRQLARAGVGLLRLDHAPLARHVHDQLALPHLGQASLRDHRRQQEQPRARHRHDGRGLAQQPPLLPALGAPGLPLVADRHDLLRAPRALRRGPRVGS